jgi:N-acetylglucosamine-6-phosphate deacetylase
MRLAYTNALIHQPGMGESFLEKHALIVADGFIEAIIPNVELPASVQVSDLQGDYLVPGFIDVQVNGGAGYLFNEAPTVTALDHIASAHAEFGVSGLLPTIISDDFSVMRSAIQAVDEAIAAGNQSILGIHLEGPFLNPKRKGVHNEKKFKQIDAEALQLMCSLKRGVTMVTLAPELCTTQDIQHLRDAGVVVSAGHSAATYADTKVALTAGLSAFTHLFNAMTPMTSREPGVVGAALEDRSSFCGLIVDGHHVHPATLKNAIAAKAKGKMILVSDAMPSVGAEQDSFELNGELIFVNDGRCVTKDGTLAGAHLNLFKAVKNCVALLGLPLEEAVRMATTYPSKLLGMDSQLGSILPGRIAKLARINSSLDEIQLLTGSN